MCFRIAQHVVLRFFRFRYHQAHPFITIPLTKLLGKQSDDELGHALLHRKENCYFIRNKTLLLNSKKEIEANRFATELLVPDSLLEEYREFTIEQISRMTGYHKRLIELRILN